MYLHALNSRARRRTLEQFPRQRSRDRCKYRGSLFIARILFLAFLSIEDIRVISTLLRYNEGRIDVACLSIDAIYGTGELVISIAIRPLSAIYFCKRIVNQDDHRWSTIFSLACCYGSPLVDKQDKLK